MDCKGHAAIVTGGGSGLGAATAAALVAAGAKVALLDVNLDGAKSVAAKIGGLAVRCDVTDSDGAAAAVKEARDKHGVARILINCAGIGTPRRIVGRDGPMPLAEFEKVIKVNLIGTFNLMRLFAADLQGQPALDDGERGVIISTASVAAYEGQIGQAAYSASKGGVVLASLPDEAQQSLAAQVPFPKLLGKPEQYAELAMHIIGNRYLNGETIRIDGAMRMGPR
jgi:NAD(P)-dependent dehydrogenase (short-subunit alcohol dehydrogenase family)